MFKGENKECMATNIDLSFPAISRVQLGKSLDPSMVEGGLRDLSDPMFNKKFVNDAPDKIMNRSLDKEEQFKYLTE